MSPEATFIEGLASGRIPIGAALAALVALIIWKGGAKQDALTAAVASVAAALTTHKTDTEKKIDGLAVHVTAETNRTIKAIEDHRLSKVEEAVDDLKGSIPDPAEVRGRVHASQGRPRG